MKNFEIPKIVNSIINGKDLKLNNNETFNNINPHSGETICKVVRSNKEDIDLAVKSAIKAQKEWALIPPVKRGQILYDIIDLMKIHKEDIAEIVSIETGKSFKQSLGETGGAIACAQYYAGEGQRLYAKTCTSGVKDKYAMTIREPMGICGLIISANTPIANVAWKVFPALICGNAVILKASEDAPLTSWIVCQIAKMTDLPDGCLNVIQGLGEEAGAPIVEHNDINLISFTGSTAVGKYIAKTAGERLAKISLELGGKNPLIICDDADIENAVKWCILSAFSNAGQRCASGSRIIIFENVYDRFKELFISETKKLKLGIGDNDDLGPVINEKQLNNMIDEINKAEKKGASILMGGDRSNQDIHKNGFYMMPTIIENVNSKDEISQKELFGPITCLYKVKNYKQALELANDSPYGLTACIHTKDVNKAADFSRKVKSGVAVINGGTFGSEPHMPFGGVKQSGNGSREPGEEALDIYSNLKDVYQFVDTSNL